MSEDAGENLKWQTGESTLGGGKGAQDISIVVHEGESRAAKACEGKQNGDGRMMRGGEVDQTAFRGTLCLQHVHHYIQHRVCFLSQTINLSSTV